MSIHPFLGFRKALKSPHFLLHYRLRAAEEVAGAPVGPGVAQAAVAPLG